MAYNDAMLIALIQPLVFLYLFFIRVYGMSEIEFITAIHYKQDGKDKVIYSSNIGKNCIDACAYGEALPKHLTQIPNNAKDIHVRTYELGQ